MALLTITTNIPPVLGGSFNVSYRKLSGGGWINAGSFTASPFTISTADVLGTNYEFSIAMDCKPGLSATSYFTTGFNCTCGITNLTNLVVSSCNVLTNTYSVSVDVTYTCMKNDLNVITSVIKAQIGSDIFYFNPTTASGTQTITINGLTSDGLSKSLSVTCIPS